jgi:hypothetical protein
MGTAHQEWLGQHPRRKSRTVATDLKVIRQFCLFRRRRDDPAAFVPGLDWTPTQREFHFVPHVFSRAEIKRMLKESGRSNRFHRYSRSVRLLFLVLYCTGLRFGEAARLDADLDLHGVYLDSSQQRPDALTVSMDSPENSSAISKSPCKFTCPRGSGFPQSLQSRFYYQNDFQWIAQPHAKSRPQEGSRLLWSTSL